MTTIFNTTLFGKYRLLSELGSGSFGTVYLSKHLQLECYRAIKLLPKQANVPNTLLSEAWLLKALHHPGIPIIYDIEEDNDFYYLIEEYVEGESLEDFLLHQSNISLEFFLNISLQLCDIFQYLHTLTPAPVLYLDLKPEHIIVCGTQIKLIDFNVSTYVSNSGNIFNLFGNKEFSAPEITSGMQPNPLWDIYSIGKIMQFLSRYVDEPLSPNIHQLIHKAAHAEPACRFETVDQLSSAVHQQFHTLRQPHSRKTIAIIGSHPGCGATHIAFSLVSTLNYMGYSATYYEKNQMDNLRQMLDLNPYMKERDGLICYRFFKGYPNYGPGIRMPAAQTAFSIYDYGSSYSSEDIDADIVLYVCSNSIWHWHNAIDKGETLFNSNNNLKIICNMGQKSAMRIYAKHFCAPIYRYPSYTDPFHISPSITVFVSQLLQLKRRNRLFFHLKNMFIPKK